MVFSNIGKSGQQKLLSSQVIILGMGALGTVVANNLCRSGIGFVRIVDRDYVDLTNLQRQVLFTEEHVKKQLPKVIAAAEVLNEINSEIKIEPIISDISSSNIENLINGFDLIVDASDNLDLRNLINEACYKQKTPWIYGGALGSEGLTMNILQKETTPCFKCLFPNPKLISDKTCSSFGVLNMITNIIASKQSAEALKILLKSKAVSHELFTIDIWENKTSLIKINKNLNCPVCVQNNYETLNQITPQIATSICGTNSIQIKSTKAVEIDFADLSIKLGKIGKVDFNEYILSFLDSNYEIKLFKDGRALIKNAIDINHAKSIYTEYISQI